MNFFQKKTLAWQKGSVERGISEKIMKTKKTNKQKRTKLAVPPSKQTKLF